MKHKSQQFELPACADAFNLAGETIIAPEPTPERASSNNRTPELRFVNREEIARLRKAFEAELPHDQGMI